MRRIFVWFSIVAICICLFVHSSSVVFGQSAEEVIVYTTQPGYECGSMQVDGSDLIILEADSEAANRSPLCHGVLSPNGRHRLIFSRVDDELVLQVVDVDDGSTRNVSFETPPAISRITWLPDSESAVFINEETAPVVIEGNTYDKVTGNWEVQRLDLADDSIKTLASFSQQTSLVFEPSPDGEDILVRNVDVSQSGPGELYSLATDGSGMTLLVESNVFGGYCPRWSPDGERLTFDYSSPASTATVTGSSVNARSGPGQNYGVVNTFSAGTELEILEQQNGWIKVLNADGQEVWVSNTVVVMPQSFGSTVEVMNADGTQQHTVGPGFNPVWSPDGNTIAFIDLSMQALLLASPEGTMTGAFPTTNIRDAFWSPDGKWIAYESGDNTSQGGGVNTQLHLLNVETGQDVVVSENTVAFTTVCDNRTIQWSSNSNWLLYRVILPVPDNPSTGLEDQMLCSTTGCTNIRALSTHFGEDVRISSAYWSSQFPQ